MAYARSIFNTQTLTILNSVDPGETINYDWSIDEDYSIVLLDGSIQLQDSSVLSGVNEYRVQPDVELSATGLGDTRSYFISLFRIDNEHVADQIVSEASKTRMISFTPSWYVDGYPENPDTTWESDFDGSSGNFTLTKSIIDTQIANSEWD